MAKQSSAPVTRKRKKVHVDSNGKAFVKATFNNTIVTLTDTYGNVIAWSTSGKNGFKGSRKSTPFAAQVAADIAAKEAFDLGLRKVEVLDDGWTVVTKDGKPSAHFEHTVAIVDGKAEILTQ